MSVINHNKYLKNEQIENFSILTDRYGRPQPLWVIIMFIMMIIICFIVIIGCVVYTFYFINHFPTKT